MDFQHQRYPSSNEFNIPDLDLNYQATAYHPPTKTWGAGKRNSVWNGTLCFYTDDVRFNALKKQPENFFLTQCQHAVEPNFTTDDDIDFPFNLEALYWKRKIAKFWQAHGISLFVDLHVCPSFRNLNLQLGVPEGWEAYANRAHNNNLDVLVEDYTLACEHMQKGFDKPVTPLYLVFGGGPAVQQLCQEQNWFWISLYNG